MKCIFVFSVMLLFGCNSDDSSLNKTIQVQPLIKETDEKITASEVEDESIPFFDFDEVILYNNPKHEIELFSGLGNSGDHFLDSLKGGVLFGRCPKDMTDLDFVNKLDKIGYSKQEMKKSSFNLLNEVFSEKKVTSGYAMECVSVFRDIFIFKKRGEIVGVSKICFSCEANHIIGTSANTDNFGMDGDYSKLFTLVHPKKSGD